MASSLEMNKALGAILLGGLVAMVSGQVAHYLVQPETHAAPGIAIAEAPTPPGGPDTGAAPAIPLASLLAAADPTAGQKIFGRCTSCHTVEKGGPNRVGPNLWGTVGMDVASHSGFSYSNTLAQIEGSWDFEKLNAFLASPRSYAPGTKMTFAGLPKPEDRAALLVWLNQQSDAALPLPEAPATEPVPETGTPENGGGETVPPTPGDTAPEGTNAPTETSPSDGNDSGSPATDPEAPAPEPAAPTPETVPSETTPSTPAEPESTTPEGATTP